MKQGLNATVVIVGLMGFGLALSPAGAAPPSDAPSKGMPSKDAPAKDGATVIEITPATQPTDSAHVKLEAADTVGLTAAIGKTAVVSGKVVSAEVSKSGKVLRVRFEGVAETGFQAVVFKDSLELVSKELGGDTTKALSGKKVAITGVIADYKGHPEVVITSGKQIEILTN